MIKWKIYYNDSTYSSDDGSVENAPENGVQVIAEIIDNKKLIHTGADIYAWDGEKWDTGPTIRKKWPVDIVVKYGLLIEDKEFLTIRSGAIKWLHNPVLK